MAGSFSLQGKLGLDSKSFVKGAKTAEDAIGDVSDELEDLPDTAEKSGGDAGKGLGGAFTKAFAAVGVAAVVGKAFNDAMDAEAGMKRVEAQFALTAEEAQRYGQLGGDLYASAWGESASDATASIAKVGVKLQDIGGIADDELAGITSQVYAVVDVFGQDFDGVVRSVGNLLQNGLAPDAEAAMDLVVGAFQNGGDEAGDLLDTIDEYSPHWAKLGIDGDEALGLIIEGFQNGFRDGDKLADLIKEFGLRSLEEEAEDAFDALGLHGAQMREQFGQGGDAARTAFGQVIDGLRRVDDPLERNRIGIELFGTQWEDLGPQALDVLQTIEVGLGDVEGAAEEMAETVSDSTAVAMEEMKRRVQTALAEVAEDGLIPLAEAAEDLSKGDFGSALSGLRDFAWEYNIVRQTAVTTWGAVRGALTETAETTGTLGNITGELTATFDENSDAVNVNKQRTEEYEASMSSASGQLNENDRRTREYNQATLAAGRSSADTGTDIEGMGDAADEAGDDIDNLKQAFAELRGEMSDRSAYLDIEDSFDTLEQAALEYLEADANGWENSEELARDYEQAQIDVRGRVLDYIEAIGGIPEEQATEIDLLIQQGKFEEAERRLAAMERARTATLSINVSVRGGTLAQRYAGVFRAEGGPVARGGSYIVGEEGPELFTPTRSGYIIPAAETAVMFSKSVSAPMPPAAIPAASNGFANVSDGVTINHYGPNLSASDVSRGYTLARLAQV